MSKVKKLQKEIEKLTEKMDELSAAVLAIRNTQEDTRERVLKALEPKTKEAAPAKPRARRRSTTKAAPKTTAESTANKA